MTGVALVDNQHKEIIFRVNRLLYLCEHYMPGVETEAQGLLDFLAYYVVNHFADEEMLQQECAYYNFNKHQQEHIDFTGNFVKLKTEFEEKRHIDESILRTINISVVDWLVNHIGQSDVHFAKYYLEFQKLKPRAPRIVRYQQ